MTPAVVLAGFLFLALAAWCFSHQRVDRTLLVLGLYLGLLDAYIKLRSGSPFATLGRDVLVAAIAGGALLRTLGAQQRLRLPPLGGFVLAFCAVVLIEVFNPNTAGALSTIAGLRQHLEFVPLFFLGYAFIREESQLRKLLFVLVLCAGVGGFVSYVQSTLSPEQFAGWGPGYRERIFGSGVFSARLAYGSGGAIAVRPFGLGADIGAGAVAAALALPALIALLMAARARLRPILLPLAIGIALAIATSGTRAGIVTALAAALAFGLIAAASRNAFRVVAGLAVAIMLVYGAFSFLGSDSSPIQRAKTISPDKALSTFSQQRGASVTTFGDYATRFPLGVGVGSSGPAATALNSDTLTAPSYNTETEWNFLVVEIGLVGLGIYLIINFRLLALALTRIRRIPVPEVRLYLAALAAPLFALLVAGFAGPTTTSVPPAPYFWFVAGVLSYWLIGARRDGRFDTPAEPRIKSPISRGAQRDRVPVAAMAARSTPRPVRDTSF